MGTGGDAYMGDGRGDGTGGSMEGGRVELGGLHGEIMMGSLG